MTRRVLRDRAAHPVINASGTFDAIAARRVYGDALLEDFPFSAFVSKTITPEPRAGNEPQRIWETPAGMINSIGLPNKGLEGFLAEDLPQLAELPVPLIVSVMATEPRGVRSPGRGGGGAGGGRGDRAERLLPQRPLGADRRRAAGGDGGAAGSAAAADREAADRQADAERRRPRRGRGRRRGGRGRRGLADQHAEGERDRPGHAASPGSRPATAASPARRCGRSRWRRCGRSPRRVGLPIVGMGGSPAAPTRSNSSPPGRRWSRSGPRASATRGPAAGSPRSCPRSSRSEASEASDLDLESRSR